jgi:phage shock protein PspC (stress-responsive transcriptional regulator)
MIAGVCAGLARRFDISVTLVRLLFLLFMLMDGPRSVGSVGSRFKGRFSRKE